MAFKKISVKDANSNIQLINSQPDAGQQVMANSMPVTIASDQVLNANTYDSSYAVHAPVYFQNTVSTNAVSLSTLYGNSIPTWATLVFITPETGVIRYRSDGTLPTSTVGQPIQQLQTWPLQSLSGMTSTQLISTSNSVVVSFEFRG